MRTALALVVVALGGVGCGAPTTTLERQEPGPLAPDGRPLTPLELAGADVVVSEGCFVCHGTSTAPALIGGAPRSARWHVDHLRDPRTVRPKSIMPRFPFLAEQRVNPWDVTERIAALARTGPPWADVSRPEVVRSLMAQGERVLMAAEVSDMRPDAQLVAVVAWLLRVQQRRAGAGLSGSGPSDVAGQTTTRSW